MACKIVSNSFYFKENRSILIIQEKSQFRLIRKSIQNMLVYDGFVINFNNNIYLILQHTMNICPLW